uniref:Uncharacterized protein n=1 Tax=Poecilia reticulata TaxID=8081 RepID=A0A3P9QHC2_POERE
MALGLFVYTFIHLNCCFSGYPGASGPPGLDAFPGEKGVPGENGFPGPTGTRGSRGDSGPAGYRGPDGISGKKGHMGIPGQTGLQGERGPVGPKGDTGLPGQIWAPNKLATIGLVKMDVCHKSQNVKLVELDFVKITRICEVQRLHPETLNKQSTPQVFLERLGARAVFHLPLQSQEKEAFQDREVSKARKGFQGGQDLEAHLEIQVSLQFFILTHFYQMSIKRFH